PHTLAIQLLPDFVSAVSLKVGIPNTLDLRHQRVVTMRTSAAQRGVALARSMSTVARRGDLQDLADRLDPERVALCVDKFPQDLSRRSSSAWAKKALASFRISFAR